MYVKLHKKLPTSFPNSFCHFALEPAMYEVVVGLMPLFVFDVVGLFNFSHSFGSVVIALGGFCLHFLLISDVEKFIFAY